MCLSPSFQGRSESLNTLKEVLRCWLHPTFDFSQVAATPPPAAQDQAHLWITSTSVNIPDSLNIFHIHSLTEYLICVHTVKSRASVRHLKNLITVISSHLFPCDLFWSSRLGGGQEKADRGVLFQSKCLPWSVDAAGGQGSTADLKRGPKASVHQHQDHPDPQSWQCSQVLLVHVQFEQIELNWRSCDPAGFSNYMCPHCLWVWTLKHEFEEQSSWELW